MEWSALDAMWIHHGARPRHASMLKLSCISFFSFIIPHLQKVDRYYMPCGKISLRRYLRMKTREFI